MGGFSGTVIALDHHPAVEGKARQNRQRGLAVEAIGIVPVRYQIVRLFEGRYLHLGLDAEQRRCIDRGIGNGRGVQGGFCVGHESLIRTSPA